MAKKFKNPNKSKFIEDIDDFIIALYARVDYMEDLDEISIQSLLASDETLIQAKRIVEVYAKLP